ncbi:hypothetical protein ABW20_dc0102276 [Dactylellina cionopaga]|nr:hypothetical protein ABW20_dc0102276 [Dactylellina cionopaga]
MKCQDYTPQNLGEGVNQSRQVTDQKLMELVEKLNNMNLQSTTSSKQSPHKIRIRLPQISSQDDEKDGPAKKIPASADYVPCKEFYGPGKQKSFSFYLPPNSAEKSVAPNADGCLRQKAEQSSSANETALAKPANPLKFIPRMHVKSSKSDESKPQRRDGCESEEESIYIYPKRLPKLVIRSHDTTKKIDRHIEETRSKEASPKQQTGTTAPPPAPALKPLEVPSHTVPVLKTAIEEGSALATGSESDTIITQHDKEDTTVFFSPYSPSTNERAAHLKLDEKTPIFRSREKALDKVASAQRDKERKGSELRKVFSDKPHLKLDTSSDRTLACPDKFSDTPKPKLSPAEDETAPEVVRTGLEPRKASPRPLETVLPGVSTEVMNIAVPEVKHESLPRPSPKAPLGTLPSNSPCTEETGASISLPPRYPQKTLRTSGWWINDAQLGSNVTTDVSLIDDDAAEDWEFVDEMEGYEQDESDWKAVKELDRHIPKC